jgi:hypothetical protein
MQVNRNLKVTENVSINAGKMNVLNDYWSKPSTCMRSFYER